MIYALYKGLYGEDFMRQSVASIRSYVDKVFIFWDDIPLGDVEEVVYKGELIKFPKPIDSYAEIVKDLASSDDCIFEARSHSFNNTGHFTYLVNDLVLPNHSKPDLLFFIEPDMVFSKAGIEGAIEDFRSSGKMCATTSQVELWRLKPCYRIPKRRRVSCIFWDLRNIDQIPQTLRHAGFHVGDMYFLPSIVHNFGFCMSEKNMYWKHLLAMAFSPVIRDSIPDPDWYEKVWLAWDPVTNNKNLEISLNYRYLIPHAVPYDVDDLPELVKEAL